MGGRGVVCRWDDARGFGFVRPDGGGPDLFLHAGEVAGGRPAVGMAVTYAGVTQDGRGPRAVGVTLPGGGRLPTAVRRAVAVGGAWFLLLTGLAAFGRLPWLLVGWSAALSVAAWAVYRADKAAAGTGARRVPEQTLHLLGLIGGWPGALVAQWALRHKNRKRAFQVLFWLAVVADVAAVALWAYHQPRLVTR